VLSLSERKRGEGEEEEGEEERGEEEEDAMFIVHGRVGTPLQTPPGGVQGV
jgi:hypothetical protein